MEENKSYSLSELVQELLKFNEEYGPLEVLLEVDNQGLPGYVPVTEIDVRVRAGGGGSIVLA